MPIFNDPIDGYDGGEASFHAMIDVLRQFFRAELRRRGLWKLPPAYLGYSVYNSWSQADALDSLVIDGWFNIIHKHVVYFKERIRNGLAIDGIIKKRLKKFVTKCQSNHDPVGFNVFNNLVVALGELERSGELVRESTRTKIDNQTGYHSSDCPTSAERATAAQIAQALSRSPIWMALPISPPETRGDDPPQDTLEDALAECKRKNVAGPRLLASIVRELIAAGIVRFRVKNLADVLKHEIRLRWKMSQSLDHVSDEAGGWNLSAVVIASGQVEPIDTTGRADPAARWRSLLDCVERKLTPRDENGLIHRVLREIRGDLLDCPDAGIPTQSVISRRLNVPRQRVNDVYNKLEPFFNDCLGE